MQQLLKKIIRQITKSTQNTLLFFEFSSLIVSEHPHTAKQWFPLPLLYLSTNLGSHLERMKGGEQ